MQRRMVITLNQEEPLRYLRQQIFLDRRLRIILLKRQNYIGMQCRRRNEYQSRRLSIGIYLQSRRNSI